MLNDMFNNWVCWAIAVLALGCYQQLVFALLQVKYGEYCERISNQQTILVLIGAMPLLGLLGTIIGLLDCFKGISVQGASGALLSGGISDALLTTQMGLVCAVPAWLMHSALLGYFRRKSQPKLLTEMN